MLFSSLDQISRRNLFDKGLPVHYYPEFLSHSAACLRELTQDTLKIINTVILPVSSYFTIDLPTDFTDDVGVFIPVGQLMHPIPKNDAITPLRTLDATGNFATYGSQTGTQPETFLGFNLNMLWYWNINDYGEPTGRYFGGTGEGKLNGYKLVKERRQIQLTETFTSCTAGLMYISDGQSADAATQIDTMAFSTIQAYINWKRGPNADNENSPEARGFYNQRRLLRAREDDLTKDDIMNIIHRSYSGAIKN
jgi:hypothetical protein